jgi:Major tropism determinant N-terminal domain
LTTFVGTVQLRHGTRAEWTVSNPVLLKGEAGVETDTNRVKYGDGVQGWNTLPYGAQDSGNIDGGAPDSVYGGTNALDGGAP